MTDQKLEEFAALAARYGRIYVAEDVYRELRRLPVLELIHAGLNRIEVVPSPFLPPGEIATVDLGALSNYTMPVTECR